jgi:hypothetical protein
MVDLSKVDMKTIGNEALTTLALLKACKLAGKTREGTIEVILGSVRDSAEKYGANEETAFFCLGRYFALLELAYGPEEETADATH